MYEPKQEFVSKPSAQLGSLVPGQQAAVEAVSH